jgi:phage shock protein A
VFKQFVTLFRGKAHDAAEAVAHRHALVILDQQIRDAGIVIRSAQRELAIAIAEDRQESERIDSLGGQIADLEVRARAALAGGREDLALLAAGTIAELEKDRDAATRAKARFRAEIARSRQTVGDAERRFAELRRGRRLAWVGEALSRARLGGMAASAMRDAEATLAALRSRQVTHAAADEALDEMTRTPAQIGLRLAQEGFGPEAGPTAASVLARLKPLALAQG